MSEHFHEHHDHEEPCGGEHIHVHGHPHGPGGIHIHVHLHGAHPHDECCHDHEHEHHHDDECCHEHEHEHEHHHDDECGHEHEHEHPHDDECCHEHEHEHHHDDECGCGHDHDHEHEHEHVHGRDFDGIHIEHHIHEGACVVSGTVTVSGDYGALKPLIGAKLEEIAAAVTGMGGIVGHVKASAEIRQTEVFSVTEEKVMIKTAPGQDIDVKMAAIVFAVTPEQVEPLLEAALREIKG